MYPYIYIWFIGAYFSSHTCSPSCWDSWVSEKGWKNKSIRITCCFEATKPTQVSQVLRQAIRNLGLLTRNLRIMWASLQFLLEILCEADWWWISNQILYILENPPTILGREISWLAIHHRKFTQKSSKKARVRDWHFSVNPGWATPTIPYNLRKSSSFNHCPETPSPMISTASRGNQCHKEKSPKLILQRVKGGARCGDFFSLHFSLAVVVANDWFGTLKLKWRWMFT